MASNIEPFEIHIPDERLAEIRRRVEAYNWAELPDAGGWNSGISKSDLQRLVNFWLHAFDWRTVENRLNRLPQFTTDIDGQRLHFVHVRGDGSKPPLLLLHGWPGSFIEFETLLEPLAVDGHDIVVPSLPGFAFSTPITEIFGPVRIGTLMHGLMARLFGRTRYIVQGGDWGAAIASRMAHGYPEALLGLHLNMTDIVAGDVRLETIEERKWREAYDSVADLEAGYSHLLETRPQTVGVAMADSPVGAAAWIVEKFGVWADLPKRNDGSPDLWARFSEEELLTNLMLYLGPPAVVTSTWIYQGKRDEDALRIASGERVRVPTGVAAFPDPVFAPPPRSFVERTYNVVQWEDMERGGHFAALEEPGLLLANLRSFVDLILAHHSRP